MIERTPICLVFAGFLLAIEAVFIFCLWQPMPQHGADEGPPGLPGSFFSELLFLLASFLAGLAFSVASFLRRERFQTLAFAIFTLYMLQPLAILILANTHPK